MKIKIVYFAYLIPNKWESIVKEQLDSLKKIQLYEESINIYMSIISDDTELSKLKSLLENNYNKVQIYNVYKDNYYEYPGIQAIYNIAEDDDDTLLLYFHSKGMTSNQHETRQYLFKYTIENYKTYINEFENNKQLETAGAIPHINGFIFFNFFWCRSSYIRNYCSKPIISDNRYIWEVWIGNEFSRKKEIMTFSPIIKYDRVTHHHEVWTIHDKMIKNYYPDIKEEPVIKEHISKPVLINNISKPVLINNNLNKVSNPVLIKTEPKPVLINNNLNEVSKPVLIKTELLINEEKQSFTEINDEIYNKYPNDMNPFYIFEKLKNKDHIVIELGSNVGLNTYMLSKRFKKVVCVEDNKNNLERLESTIRQYCYKNITLCKKRIVQVKENLENDITIKEILYTYIHRLFQKVSLIVCDCNILEDVLHYGFQSKCKLFIKIPDNYKEYNYLFDYFDYNKNLLKTDNWLLFEPKNNPELRLFKKNMSIVIIGYNQYTYISKMVAQLEKYTNDIIIIDNFSDYKPLLKYYETEYKYTLLKMDKNYGHKVYEMSFIINLLGYIYIITDPDLEFNKNLPNNCIAEMIEVSKTYKAGRVGFAIEIESDDIRDGLSYAGMDIKTWERRFWKSPLEHPYLKLYSAAIDTTFCLLNMYNNIYGLSIRVGGDFICKHLPWYNNYWLELLDDEYSHYLVNNKSSNFWVKNKTDNKPENKPENKPDNKPDNKPENKPENNESYVFSKETNQEFNRIKIEIEKNINLEDWVIDKVKNDNGIGLNIGTFNVTNFNNKFKLLLNVDNSELSNGDNILYYSKKLNNIKLNDNYITFKEFIYNTTIYQEIFTEDITFINISENSDILEEVLYYSINNNINICIHNLEDYNFLSEYVDYFTFYIDNKIITNINDIEDNVLLISKKNTKQFYKKNISCIIDDNKIIENINTNDIIILTENSELKSKYTILNINNKNKDEIIKKIIGNYYFMIKTIKYNQQLLNNMQNILKYFNAKTVSYNKNVINKNYKVIHPNIDCDIYLSLTDTYTNSDVYLINTQNNGNYIIGSN
jgi:hypothetical protein